MSELKALKEYIENKINGLQQPLEENTQLLALKNKLETLISNLPTLQINLEEVSHLLSIIMNQNKAQSKVNSLANILKYKAYLNDESLSAEPQIVAKKEELKRIIDELQKYLSDLEIKISQANQKAMQATNQRQTLISYLTYFDEEKILKPFENAVGGG